MMLISEVLLDRDENLWYPELLMSIWGVNNYLSAHCAPTKKICEYTKYTDLVVFNYTN